jgi:hypothetical protein
VGNTPAIVAHAGQKIRWYVFNLDLGMGWHNFHVQPALEVRQRDDRFAQSMARQSRSWSKPHRLSFCCRPPLPPRRIRGTVRGRAYHLRDFLFHCHVEMHMMQGPQAWCVQPDRMAHCRASATAPAESGLAIDHSGNTCPTVDDHRCEEFSCGKWELVSGATEVCMMHPALLPNAACADLRLWRHATT